MLRTSAWTHPRSPAIERAGSEAEWTYPRSCSGTSCVAASWTGLHFRRQHPIGRYILDFYCDEAKLAVEVDGYSHDVADRPARDLWRDNWLASRDVTTLRITARDVLKSMDDVLATILAAARP
jgi:very-short-patch-repair endonuclease